MKVEVLGCGNQFVVDGMHASGVPLEWRNGSPETVPSADLTPVTEEQIDAFFAAIAPLIKPTGEKPAGPTSDRTSILGLEASDPLRIIAALADIPNVSPANWEDWNYIGMAVWAATGGSEAGRTAFHRWSARNPTYDAKETEERWHHWHKSPPTQVGAGTLFRLAAEARKRAAPATTAVTTGLLSIDEVEALPDPGVLV
jgi:hypothetical protein